MFFVQGALTEGEARMRGYRGSQFLTISALAVGLTALSLEPSLASDLAHCVPGPVPSQAVKQSEVYGIVKFAFDSKRGTRPTSDPLRVLLAAVTSLLTHKEGEYILTIEVLGNNDEVLARRAILQAKREESGFLIFNRVQKESGTSEWWGNVLTTAPLDESTNNIRVKVRSYYTSETKLDLGTFNLLLDFIAKTKSLGVTPELQSAWQPITATMEALIHSYEQQDLSDVVTLSFAKFNQSPFPQSCSFVKNFTREEDSGKVPYQAAVNIRLEPVKARIVTLTASGEVLDPVAEDIFNLAKGPGDVLIKTLLSNSTDEVKGLLAGLKSDKGYEGIDIIDRCQAVYGQLASYLTLRDATALNWAVLHHYDHKLILNKLAGGCLSVQEQEQMKKLGLRVDDLAILKSPGIPVAAGPRPAKSLGTLGGSAKPTFDSQFVPLAGIVPTR
jgi:hypothetical protein